MENDPTITYQGNRENHPQNNNHEPQPENMKVTLEEMRLLRECNRESFYYRCMPFALTGMGATYLAVQKGYLTPHPRWGPALKMTGAAFVGWLVGKFSYRSVCEEKFLHLENSKIGDAIRKKRGYGSEIFQSEQFSSISREDDSSKKSDDIRASSSGDYHSSSGSLNFDVDKNVQYSGLDDRERPTSDSSSELIKEDDPVKRSTSYDELRRKNRSAQSQNNQSSNQRSNQSGYDNRSYKRNDYEQSPEGAKNAYGDVWEKPNY